MAFITREDGVNFVIPSYREVFTAKNKSTIKKDVLALSKSYGEYITMQKKGENQYEVAFSPDLGYLLGETVWYNFNRPNDLIYCEALPNSTDAILVIVKNGSVYLDGRFPIDNIAEELVIFLSQENHFNIYIYGDVPISKNPEPGKFSFEESSVESFNILAEPVFEKLPLIKAYRFETVNVVLKAYGIGVIPLNIIAAVAGVLIVGYLFYNYMTREKPKPVEVVMEPNPLQEYVDALTSPAPEKSMDALVQGLKQFLTIPGWNLKNVTFNGTSIEGNIVSPGVSLKSLQEWCGRNDATMSISTNGVLVARAFNITPRLKPTKIYPVKQAIMIFIDRLLKVYPGNHITMTNNPVTGPYINTAINIDIVDATPQTLALLGKQFEGLPFILSKVSLSKSDSNLFNGSVTVNALGK